MTIPADLLNLAGSGWKDSVYQIPPGTDGFAWHLAAAWADVPIAELLRDTAPVKSAHYMAALRVRKTVEYLLGIEDLSTEARMETMTLPPFTDGAETEGEGDSFARLMLLAEGFDSLKATYRDRGDAAMAAEYAGFETTLLQIAAKVQIANDIDKVGK